MQARSKPLLRLRPMSLALVSESIQYDLDSGLETHILLSMAWVTRVCGTTQASFCSSLAVLLVLMINSFVCIRIRMHANSIVSEAYEDCKVIWQFADFTSKSFWSATVHARQQTLTSSSAYVLGYSIKLCGFIGCLLRTLA